MQGSADLADTCAEKVKVAAENGETETAEDKGKEGLDGFLDPETEDKQPKADRQTNGRGPVENMRVGFQAKLPARVMASAGSQKSVSARETMSSLEALERSSISFQDLGPTDLPSLA